MNEGISPVTGFSSRTPSSIDAGDRIWKVTNYDHTYLGQVSLSRALGHRTTPSTRNSPISSVHGNREDGTQPRYPEPPRTVLLDRARVRWSAR